VKENIFLEEEYNASISPIMYRIRALLERAKWSGHHIKAHPPASKIDKDEMFDVMRKLISPTIDNQLITNLKSVD
jgi:hypothetical protein